MAVSAKDVINVFALENVLISAKWSQTRSEIAYGSLDRQLAPDGLISGIHRSGFAEIFNLYVDRQVQSVQPTIEQLAARPFHFSLVSEASVIMKARALAVHSATSAYINHIHNVA